MTRKLGRGSTAHAKDASRTNSQNIVFIAGGTMFALLRLGEERPSTLAAEVGPRQTHRVAGPFIAVRRRTAPPEMNGLNSCRPPVVRTYGSLAREPFAGLIHSGR